jgi:hypothetical protein
MELLYVVLGLLVLYLFMNKCGCGIIEGIENYDPITGGRIWQPTPGSETSCCWPGTCDHGFECDSGGFWGNYCKRGRSGPGSVKLGFMSLPATGACKRK